VKVVCACGFPVGLCSTSLLHILDRKLSESQLGRGDALSIYPHHSPDLSPVFFFLLGVCRSRCLSWRSAECWVTESRYQWSAWLYPTRNWVSSWCVSCH